MPGSLQNFLAFATPKASDDLVAAFLRLPEDKRSWSPGGTARSALDQMAECAILTGYTANVVQERRWPDIDIDGFFEERDALIAQGWGEAHPLLQESIDKVVAAIATVSDAELAQEIESPFGTQTLAMFVTYSYWNMSYHQGQINYIASLLGNLS